MYFYETRRIKSNPSNRLMPRISKEHKKRYKSKIRSLLSQNSQISQRELKLRLTQEGYQLDRRFLGSLLKAIYRERTKRADTMTLNQALASFQDVVEFAISNSGRSTNGLLVSRRPQLPRWPLDDTPFRLQQVPPGIAGA